MPRHPSRKKIVRKGARKKATASARTPGVNRRKKRTAVKARTYRGNTSPRTKEQLDNLRKHAIRKGEVLNPTGRNGLSVMREQSAALFTEMLNKPAQDILFGELADHIAEDASMMEALLDTAFEMAGKGHYKVLQMLLDRMIPRAPTTLEVNTHDEPLDLTWMNDAQLSLVSLVLSHELDPKVSAKAAITLLQKAVPRESA